MGVFVAIQALTLPANAAAIQQDSEEGLGNEKELLSSVRQLTFDGRRAGEGYYNAEGTKMVFQSERDPANPFFQIFMMDFEFGDVTPVSPGHGKTTCAWIHPNNKQVLFSSTHDDPEARKKQRAEIEFRESGQERRYSWDYDENYEMYAFDIASKKYTRLTNIVGYDAEGSYSPDGKLIAFASNRKAYSEKMSEEQQEKFDLDPAYMMDIFVMNADGSNVRQLTTVPGYDGGPFFSPDGKRICWRRFAEHGATAEIMTMNVDGSDQKQLTRLNKMSWAPFYHPSGKYLVFATNKHGFSNFELYLVDVDGKSAPVRVTTTAGFDGLGSFSPDGTKLTWTSNRNEKKQSQIHLGSWNHEKAVELLKIDSLESAVEKAAAEEGVESASKTAFDFEARDMVRHVDYLCRKELGGRMTGSSGEKQATAYVAAYMDNLGLKPAGDEASWYQEFQFPNGAKLGTGNRLSFDNIRYQIDDDWRPLTFSKNGEVEAAPVAFVGYGIVAEKTDEQAAYDSYAGVDIKGKWALMFRYLPEDVDEKRRAFLANHSDLRKKIMVARDKGAVGIIVVSGPSSNVKDQLVPLTSDFSNAGSSVAAISISDKFAQHLLIDGGIEGKLDEVQQSLDSGKPFESVVLKKVKLKANIDVEQVVGTGRNVIGRLQVGDSPAPEAIIVGAHIDHLGRGTGGSLAKGDEKGNVHVGADDNASGVAAMLEVAEFLAGLKRNGKLNMKRDVLFAGWSGEELGLHGSKFFVTKAIPAESRAASADQALAPYNGDPHDLEQLFRYYEQYLAKFDAQEHSGKSFELLESNTADMKIVVKLLSGSAANAGGRNDKIVAKYTKLIAKAEQVIENVKNGSDAKKPTDSAKTMPITACLNMDMVGRMEGKVVMQGLGSSNEWNGIIEKANLVVGLPIEPSDDTRLPTDARSFYQAGVPILSAFTGSHQDYHTPRDTPEKLNYPDAARIAKLMGLVARNLTIAEQTPKYVKQKAAEDTKRVARSGRRARLGTVPNYTEKVTGVLLDDVESGGPADSAGVMAGDVIVELAGKKIENIYDYQYAIDSLKVGKQTGISVMREKKRVDLKITPGSRD